MSKYTEIAREVRDRTDIHYNCAQGVLAAFAGELGVDDQTAFLMGANFGSGRRMGSPCGAVTGALMVLGLAGAGTGPEAKELLRKVRENHQGKLNCKDLLKLNMETDTPKKVHCDGMVCELVDLTEEILREKGIVK